MPNPDFLAITYNQQLSNSIVVTANQTYTLSALVHGNGATATGDWAVQVHYYNASGTLLGSFTDLGPSASGTTTTTGQTISGMFVAPANAASMKIALSSALTAGTLKIDTIAFSQMAITTKYYFAGAQRVATPALALGASVRTGSTLSYLLSDHLGSTSLTTNSSGGLVSELRYKPWGEVRYTSGTTPTKYQYTGQFSYQSDFGLLFYNARMYDQPVCDTRNRTNNHL